MTGIILVDILLIGAIAWFGLASIYTVGIFLGKW
jgi:hypothetical protein